jgi:hypothetical protein
MKPHTIGLFALVFLMALSMILSYQAGRMEGEVALTTAKLYCAVGAIQYLNQSNGAVGVAYGDVFCVDGTRDISEVLNTCAHEWSHTHEHMRDATWE